MRTTEVPRDQWIQALDQFSEAHQGWIITMELVGVDVRDQIPATNRFRGREGRRESHRHQRIFLST